MSFITAFVYELLIKVFGRVVMGEIRLSSALKNIVMGNNFDHIFNLRNGGVLAMHLGYIVIFFILSPPVGSKTKRLECDCKSNLYISNTNSVSRDNTIAWSEFESIFLQFKNNPSTHSNVKEAIAAVCQSPTGSEYARRSLEVKKYIIESQFETDSIDELSNKMFPRVWLISTRVFGAIGALILSGFFYLNYFQSDEFSQVAVDKQNLLRSFIGLTLFIVLLFYCVPIFVLHEEYFSSETFTTIFQQVFISIIFVGSLSFWWKLAKKLSHM